MVKLQIFGGSAMDLKKTTVEIEGIKKSELSEDEKKIKVIELAKELGKFLLEERLKK